MARKKHYLCFLMAAPVENKVSYDCLADLVKQCTPQNSPLLDSYISSGETETKVNWLTLYTTLRVRSVYANPNNCFILCIKGVKHFCDAFDGHHGFCCRHILGNARDYAKKQRKEVLHDYHFWEAVNAENKADFQKAMTKISVNCENTAAYLEKIEHSRWALCYVREWCHYLW